MAVVDRGRGGGEADRQRVSFVRPKHTSIDWACPRVEEEYLPLPPSLLFLLLLQPWSSSSSPVGTLFLRPPPPSTRSSLSPSARSRKRPTRSRERRTCTCVRDSTRSYMWHGEGLLWRPTLGTGVKRHWPARGPRPIPPYVCVNAWVRVRARGRARPRALSLFLATVHVDLLRIPL